MEIPFILHTLQWLGNLFLGHLFLKVFRSQRVKMETGQAWQKVDITAPTGPSRVVSTALLFCTLRSLPAFPKKAQQKCVDSSI